jgi:hypothetical protein
MLKTEETFTFILQGLPVLFIIMYLLFPGAFTKVSKHPLGKMIAVFIICMYTYRDMTYGLFICLLVILYYHREMENFLSGSTTNYVKYLPKQSTKQNSAHFESDFDEQEYTYSEEAYPMNRPLVKRVSEALFRKEKCVNSKVLYKKQHVKNHVVTHVYPELNFIDGECNPCDPTCHFTIDSKQATEDKLKPRSTRDNTLRGDILTFLGFPPKEPFGLEDTNLTPFQ